ncbi:KamA family radical SAM protein [Fusibacter paucivorans]|uniref:KamA family radical SAM protein n=1 Tax=Fusibacter paucivorans TaxID=76009 RepID=A0ABS5PPB7_9FIRM|nr:KamA family radical SAM protein [Fusibacter paucivorans]MBS7526426.1 KamA family radical SAM protein [Fusibacter paucivorans]
MSWKDSLKSNIHSVDSLRDFLPMSEEEVLSYRKIAKKFPISSTQYYLNLIDIDDPHDPIRKMAIPTISEFDMDGTFDTSGESQNTKMKGLQHKYEQTALLLSTNKCAMYCRHCFRKRLVGTSSNETLSFIKDAVSYIQSHETINNVLITGGDAFLLETDLIESYLKELTEIPHLDFIRFGTRTPVVFPERITSDLKLLELLKKYSEKKRIYVVTQFNHPKELTDEAIGAVSKLLEHNVIVNNQTVLLKGVNDHPKTLSDLQNRLVKHGIVPYYIFQCRPVKGVKNQFQVPLDQAFDIVKNARKLMNGHSKRLKFCMSHETGKIEIIGRYQSEMLFKYHQSKYPENHGRIFSVDLKPNQAWLESDDIQS